MKQFKSFQKTFGVFMTLVTRPDQAWRRARVCGDGVCVGGGGQGEAVTGFAKSNTPPPRGLALTSDT